MHPEGHGWNHAWERWSGSPPTNEHLVSLLWREHPSYNWWVFFKRSPCNVVTYNHGSITCVFMFYGHSKMGILYNTGGQVNLSSPWWCPSSNKMVWPVHKVVNNLHYNTWKVYGDYWGMCGGGPFQASHVLRMTFMYAYVDVKGCKGIIFYIQTSFLLCLKLCLWRSGYMKVP